MDRSRVGTTLKEHVGSCDFTNCLKCYRIDDRELCNCTFSSQLMEFPFIPEPLVRWQHREEYRSWFVYVEGNNEIVGNNAIVGNNEIVDFQINKIVDFQINKIVKVVVCLIRISALLFAKVLLTG